jgi:AraC-like DNA-binding protein
VAQSLPPPVPVGRIRLRRPDRARARRYSRRMDVSRHESAELRWEMATRDAHPRLTGYVRNYTGYTEMSAAPLCRREVPSADVTMILSPLSELTLRGTSAPARHTSFVAALHDRHALVEHGGFQEGVEVRLTPLGAHALFGLPMHELTNRVIELDELLGREADALVGRMWERPSWEQRFAFLDAAIAARAARAREHSPGVAWAWQRLRATHGRAGVRALADELGWSHRRLIARFREQVGMPPKTVGRLLRFDRVAQLLRHVEAPRLAEVAYECGYYDQSHLNRDFRDFAGTTPGEYLARRLPEGGGVSVNSVQDEGTRRS